jgi:YHS domain-containing protein
LGSVERVNLREQVDRWVSQGLAWVARKLFAQILGSAKQPSVPSARETRNAIPLHRDPWCGTYVSSEISVPLEQSGQVLHFCSQECRARYQGSAKRAAGA